MTISVAVPDKNKPVPTKEQAVSNQRKSNGLIIGTETIDPKKLIRLNFGSLLHHTIIVGQSGSGKSYFVARLIEEILLRTSARIVIIDPNGDFRQVDSIDDGDKGTWKRNEDPFAHISSLMRNSDDPIYDSKDEFAGVWRNRQFLYLNPVLSESQAGKTKRKLIIHWESLDDDLQSFLLTADPAREPRIALGIETIIKTARKRQKDRSGKAWFDLQELQKIADEYAVGKIAYGEEYENEKAHGLKKDDWHAIHTRITEVRKYQLWHPREKETDEANDPWRDHRWSPPPLGLADFVDQGFEPAGPTDQRYWDALVLSLDASGHKDTLLAVEVALSRLWEQAKREWRKNAERPSPADEEVGPGAQNSQSYLRVPTFIVIDEAHNFAPETTTNALQERVTANLIRIASEGRKYGLYLILATQRPTKLHKGLVPECENTCLLRVQSDSELDYACQILGYRKENVSFVKSFTGGRGLFNGRWVDNPMGIDTKIAPARTIVGGGGLGDVWMNPRPEPIPKAAADGAVSANAISEATTPETAEEATPKEFIAAQAPPNEEAALEQIRSVVVKSLPLGKDQPLAQLANSLRRELTFLKAGDWMGRESFTDLLTDARVEGVTITKGTPGYAYKGELEDLQKIPDNIRAIMKTAHDNLGLVILNKYQFELIFKSISDELQGAEFDLNIVAKAVQTECARHKSKIGDVGRPAIDFIVRTLYFSDHSFDSDRPQTAAILAGSFADNIIRRVKEIHPIGKESEQNFRDYFSTALFEKGG